MKQRTFANLDGNEAVAQQVVYQLNEVRFQNKIQISQPFAIAWWQNCKN